MRQPPPHLAAATHLAVSAAVSLSVLSFVLAFVLTPASARAEVGDLRVGGRVGGGWAALTQPEDPRGEPTLLQGSGFSGGGLMVGATGAYDVTELPIGLGFARADLLLAYQGGSGFAERTDAGTVRRREVELHTTMLRLPVFAGVEHTFEPVDVRLMVGLELLLGMVSGATVTEENLPATPQPLFTTPTTHVGLASALGFAYRAGDYSIPVDLRLTWDPFVPDTTVERFEGYRSEESPGEYGVGFELYLGVTVGVDYEL